MTPARPATPAVPMRRLPLHRGFLLLLVVLLALPAVAKAQQNPSFSNIVFTPASGATLRVGDQVRVAVTVSNAPSGVRLFFGPSGSFASSLAAFFTSVGGDRYEAVYSVSSGALEIAQNGAVPLYFQIQATKGSSTTISSQSSTYTIAPAGSGGGEGLPDVTLALPAGQSLSVTTAGSDVRVSAGVVISNLGTTPAGVFNGAVVLSPSQTYNLSTLLRDPANGGILRGNFAFAEFAKSAGQPVTALPPSGSFDQFSGSLTLPAASYAALLAQSPVPLYAFAVMDFDNGLAESNEDNNAVLLGQLTAPTPGGTAVTVPADANIYGAGLSAPTPVNFGGAGVLPPAVNFTAGAGKTLSFSSVTGAITIDRVTQNGGFGPNPPDGGPYYAPTEVTPTGSLSGINAPTAGFLVGVFLGADAPAGSPPPTLNFNESGPAAFTRNFQTLEPQIGQVFFIGDGHTDDGAAQRFFVPPTATRLFLGIADAADGDSAAGPAQAFGDNGGSFVASYLLTGGSDGEPAPFTVDLKGVKDGGIVAPGTEVAAKAKIRLPKGVEANIAKVEFFEDNELAGTDTEAAYKFARTYSRARTVELTAVATDDQGRSATSAPVRFRVAAGAAGPLALDTSVEPAGGAVTPGAVITYLFSVTNTGQTFAAANVVVTAPVPDGANYDGSKVLDDAGSRKVADDKRSVTFRFNDIPAGQTRRAQLSVRLPFDARITGSAAQPITTDDILVTGNGFGGVAVEGRFEPVSLTPTGPLPARAPRLALLKTIADRDGDPTDDLDIVDDPEFGPIPAVGENGVLTLVFLAYNYGEEPAQKVTIKDRLPDGFELVADSARVNDTAAGGLLKVNGRTIKFNLGDFQPGESVGLTYQIRKLPRAQGEPVGRLVVESRGAEISSLSLRGAPDSIPEILPIRIVPKAIPLILETYAQPARPSVDGMQTYTVRYRNEGKKSKNAKITASLPAGTTFRSATSGGALQGDGRTVVFSLGDVPSEARGEVSVDVNVTAAARADDNIRLRFSAAFSDNKFVTRSAPELAATARTRANDTPDPIARADGDDLLRPVVDDSFLFAADVPRLGILKYAPQSVPFGGTFSYLYVAMNHGKVDDRFVQLTINAPNGAVFDSFTSPTVGATVNRNEAGYTLLFGDLKPQETRSIKITFRATAPAGTRIDEGRTVGGSASTPFRSQSLSTLIVDGDAAAPDNQIAILRAQLESIGLDATVALADPAIRARARLIGNDSGGFKVAGADYLQLSNGALAIPLGAGQLVAAGGGNLIGNDGSTLIGNDGSTLVAAGGGNLIRFNGLIGNDGSTLASQSATSLFSASGLKGLVAARGGNLVAAGGGNLVGNDGASLIGLDGSTLRGIDIASLVGNDGASLVAAGGGNLFGNDGASLVAAGGGNLVSSYGLGLVAAGGGNLVAAGGGNLVAAGGGNALSRDVSRAAGLGANGTFIVGGGGSLVAAGGGN